MILYSVTVSVESDIEAEWLQWMQEAHIPEVMATGYFEAYRMARLLQPKPEIGSVTYNIQYQCTSMAQYKAYDAKEAPALRQATLDRFGQKTVAFRTLLEAV